MASRTEKLAALLAASVAACDAQIDTTAADLDTAEQALDTAESSITALQTAVATAQSTAASAASAASAAQSTATSAASAASAAQTTANTAQSTASGLSEAVSSHTSRLNALETLDTSVSLVGATSQFLSRGRRYFMSNAGGAPTLNSPISGDVAGDAVMIFHGIQDWSSNSPNIAGTVVSTNFTAPGVILAFCDAPGSWHVVEL